MSGRLFVCIGAMALLCFPLFSQETRGRISGRVIDSSGAVIPAVEVKAINADTNVAATVATNAQGSFDIPYLAPGTYSLSAELAGFKRYIGTKIELRVDDDLSFEIKLEPGQVTESVTVTGVTPLLEVGISLGQVVDNKRITELPLAGGNAYTLAALTAGVLSFSTPNHPSLAPATNVISNIGVSGVRDHNSEFAIDGAPSMGGRNASFVPPSDMIGEFKVETLRFDAASRSPGGSINVALKSGTNQIHGTLSENHSDNKFGGIDFFQRQFLYNPATGPLDDAKRQSVNPRFVFNHFGATLGGPARRNRTFWMYGFDGLARPSQERGTYTHTVPSLKQRQGDFSDLLAVNAAQYQIYDPATTVPAAGGRYSRQPLAGNVIPKSRLDPMALGFLKYWPTPNMPGLADGENNYWGVLPSYNQYFSHTVRVDHNFSESHRVFFRYTQGHQLFDSSNTLPNGVNGSHENRSSRGFGFDDVYVISPRLLLNVRYSLARTIDAFSPLGLGTDLVGLGFPQSLVSQIDSRGVTFPRINLDNYELLGNTWPNGAYTNYHTWGSDVTMIRGKQNIRIGGEFRLYRAYNIDYTANTPRIDFSTNWTRGPLDNAASAPIGQDLASFLFGLPTGGKTQINASYAEQSTYTAGFIQDEYKLTPSLTLNLGLRYEYETPPTERYNRSVTGFDFSAVNPIQAQAQANYAQNPIAEVPVSGFRTMGGLQFAGVNGNSRSLWRTDKNNFAPRAGFALSLPHSMVARAGYGLYYMTNGVDRVHTIQTGYDQVTTLVPSLDNGQTFVATLKNPFPGGIVQPQGAAAGLATNLGLATTFFNADRSHRYMQRWSAGIQKQLPHGALLEVSYAGTTGSRLEITRQWDAVPRQYLSTSPQRDSATNSFLTANVPNPFYPMLIGTDIGGKTVARSQLLRPYPQFNGITSSGQDGYSWYHSMQVRVQRRFRNGFTIQGNYTWSKFMEATGYLNATDPRPEYGISDQDRPQRFVVNGIYELPFGSGRKFGAAWRAVPRFVVSGWQVSAVYQGQSGAALGFGNVLLYGNVQDIVLPRSERSPSRWFNTSKFETVSGQQLVNNIRTFPSRLTGLRGPGINLWNSSLMRNFRITERMRFQLRSEWLNATNHSFFSNPNMSPTNKSFGTITATNGYPRQIYFSGKLIF